MARLQTRMWLLPDLINFILLASGANWLNFLDFPHTNTCHPDHRQPRCDHWQEDEEGVVCVSGSRVDLTHQTQDLGPILRVGIIGEQLLSQCLIPVTGSLG